MESNTSINRLRDLRGSGYEIEDGQPDITGWTIKDGENRKIGVVDDLLFDPEAQKVRYIIANLKNNDFDLDRRKVLIPIGVAELAESNDDVIIPSVTVWQIRALPTYSSRFNDNDEQEIYSIFSSTTATSTSPAKFQPRTQNFYENETYSYDNLFKRRQQALKDKSGFKLKKGANKPVIRDNDAEYDVRRKEINEPDVMSVNSDYNENVRSDFNDEQRRLRDENIREQRDESNDRLLHKIKRLQDELDDIEKDLRSNREGRF
jgi:hypothetical protein